MSLQELCLLPSKIVQVKINTFKYPGSDFLFRYRHVLPNDGARSKKGFARRFCHHTNARAAHTHTEMARPLHTWAGASLLPLGDRPAQPLSHWTRRREMNHGTRHAARSRRGGCCRRHAAPASQQTFYNQQEEHTPNPIRSEHSEHVRQERLHTPRPLHRHTTVSAAGLASHATV